MSRSSSLALIVSIVAVIGIGLGVDARSPSLATDRPPPVEAENARAGAWYCAAAGDDGSNEVQVVAAAPPASGKQPSVVLMDQFHDGQTERMGEVARVAPATSTAQQVDETAASGVAARWWRRPAAVSRVWQANGPGPTGYVTGPCEPGPSPAWIFPGLATAGGAAAQLHLANPFRTDASVSIVFTTSEGLLEPKRLENVVVPARGVIRLEINEHAPERPDLGVIVRTRSGRVVVEATQSFNAAIGGIDGRSLVHAAREPAESWTMPWFEDREGETASWLWISNVDAERPASVTLNMHTDAGGHAPEGLEDITIDPGQVRRVDLRGLLPKPTGGVTVRSENGVPIVASVVTQYTAAPEERTGVAVQLGAKEPDSEWVLSGGPTPGRQAFLHVANPTGQPAVADVRLSTSAGNASPPALQGVKVPPGGVVAVDVGTHLPEADNFSAFVRFRQGEGVVGLRAFDAEGTRRLVATLGVPSRVWTGGDVISPVEYAPSLPQRVGTANGPAPEPSGLPAEPGLPG